MAIGLTEEHEALAEAVRGWAERHVPISSVREVLGAEAETLPSFWTGLAEQGLLGLHVPEQYGGQGAGLVELAVALEALGTAVVPGPFLPTVLASAALLAADEQVKARAELVPALADGSRTGALALASGITGRRDGTGMTISGTAEPVLGGALADVLILAVTTDEGEEWVAVDAADLTVTGLTSLDRTRRVARVEAADVGVPAERILTGLESTEILDLAAILMGAEAVGLADWCVRTAAEYAKVRVQFGRPIGQFQGVKHKCAWMLIALEEARAAVWDAARSYGSSSFAAGVAAAIAPDAALRCARDCIQVLGGIGFTWEHDAHLYLRRTSTLQALLGRPAEWAGAVAEMALDGNGRAVEVELDEESESLRARIAAEIAALPEGDGRTEALADGGLVAPHLPEPWGRDATPLEQVLIIQELRKAGIKRPEMGIGAWAIPSLVTYGTPEQQERFLRPTLRGEVVWCQLFSEPGAGSDLASLQMKAERVEGGYKLTGQKIWTSLAQYAQWAICVARTSVEPKKHDGITYFVVDMKAEGVDVRPLREMTGEAMFNEVFLDGVFVPDDQVIGEVGQGWKVARNTLSNERVSLSSGGGLGAGTKELLGYFKEARSPRRGDQGHGGGKEVDQVAQAEIGALVCQGQAIDLLGLRLTLKQLSGTSPGAEASVRKLLGVKFNQEIADYVWAAQGAEAAVEEKGRASGLWARYMLFSRAMTIYGGTTEVQLNIIAERMLGLPRDPEPGK